MELLFYLSHICRCFYGAPGGVPSLLGEKRRRLRTPNPHQEAGVNIDAIHR